MKGISNFVKVVLCSLFIFGLILVFLNYIGVQIPFANLFGDAFAQLKQFFGEMKGVGESGAAW